MTTYRERDSSLDDEVDKFGSAIKKKFGSDLGGAEVPNKIMRYVLFFNFTFL